MAIELDRRRSFGSLHTGRDVSALRPDECPVFRNVQHDIDGRTRKRSGIAVRGAIGQALEPDCWYQALVKDGSGQLASSTQYYVRVTHVTGAGETDPIRQTGQTFNTGPAGHNALRLWLPFHLRKKTVTAFHDLPADTPGLPDFPVGSERVYMLEISDGPAAALIAACPDAYKGYLVYSRAPRIEDQTRLGANPDAAMPCYNRTVASAKVHAVGTYNGNTVFVLDQRVPQIGQTGKIDRDTVDIMMPDRAGLPILWANIYLSPTDGTQFRHAGIITDGGTPATVLEWDAANALSPLDRLDRHRPTVAGEAVYDVGARGQPILANSGIKGGVYAVRTTHYLSDRSMLHAPGWEEAAVALGLGGRRSPLRARQESWPSRVAYAEIHDGHAIKVDRGFDPLPDTSGGWNVYVAEVEPDRILSFDDSARGPDTSLHTRLTPAADYGYGSGLDLRAYSTPFPGFTEYEDDNAFPAQPATDLDARGFPPAYAQVRRHVEASDGTADDWRFASSYDGHYINRHRLWWPLDTVEDATDYAATKFAVLRIFLRARKGMPSSYSPATLRRVKIRAWFEDGNEWRVLKEFIAPEGGFVEHNIPIDLGGALANLFCLTSFSAGTRQFALIDVTGEDAIGFDIAEPTMRLYRHSPAADQSDPSSLEPASDGEVLQYEGLTAARQVIKHPLARQSWRHRSIRQDNTAQWPTQLFEQKVPGNRGPSGQTSHIAVGCCDSMFRLMPGGNVQRLYQYEGDNYAKVVSDDYQQCNYLWRLFFCNPGLSEWNLRWDGQQTWPMGLAPAEEGLAEITSIAEPAAGPGVAENVELEWYGVWRRTVDAGNGYVVRSEPFRLTETVKVNLRDGFPSSVQIEGTLRPEPQDTHLELYRNQVGTAWYVRIAEIPISDAVVNADGTVRLSYNDTFDGTDGDIDIPIQFDTGRPPASVFWIFHRGRVCGVAQQDRERVWYSNVTSPSGIENPEGWHDQNIIDPPLKIAAAVSCLSGAEGPLRISTLRGMARADSQGNVDGADAWTVTAINADTGWVGPRAWYETNDVERGLTPDGPGVRQGDQLRFCGSPARELLDHAHLDARIAYNSFVIQAPDGRMWHSFSDDPMGTTNGVLALHEEKLGEGVQPYWAEWRLRAHSACLTQGITGKHELLLGGQDGRIYRYGGRHKTDAGIFIPARMRGRPESLNGPAGRARPDICNWWLHGDRTDTVLIAVRKDMEVQRTMQVQPMRLACNVPPVDALGYDIPLFGTGRLVPGDGTEYGLPDARAEIERTTTLGTIFRQFQLEVYQELDEMPVGSPREASFEVAGYVLTGDRRTTEGSRP